MDLLRKEFEEWFNSEKASSITGKALLVTIRECMWEGWKGRHLSSNLPAQVEILRTALECTRQPHMDYIPKLDMTAQQVLDATPRQCLAEVRAVAGREGYVAGSMEEVLNDTGGHPVSDVYVEHINELADRYANGIRQKEI